MNQTATTPAPVSRTFFYKVSKRCLDLIVCIPALVILTPIMLVIAAAIKSTSSGPAIFRQKRIGLDKKAFTIYKFRTMRVGSELHGCATIPSDPRITDVGKFIRPPHLDELPQLWNIIRGDMSLVGPRPRSLEQYSQVNGSIPKFYERTRVKPGLTGPAQLGTNHDHTVEGLAESLAADLRYIRNPSLIKDAGILARTALVVLRGKGI